MLRDRKIQSFSASPSPTPPLCMFVGAGEDTPAAAEPPADIRAPTDLPPKRIEGDPEKLETEVEAAPLLPTPTAKTCPAKSVFLQESPRSGLLEFLGLREGAGPERDISAPGTHESAKKSGPACDGCRIRLQFALACCSSSRGKVEQQASRWKTRLSPAWWVRGRTL
jgi:hypothetical protein